MQLEGMIATKCPPDQVAQLLMNPSALRKLLPAGCEVGERAGESVPFVIRHKVGPIMLSMSGNLTLTRTPEAAAYDLVIQASHMVAGRVRIALVVVPDTRAAHAKRLRWNGELDAHGLAARLVDGRAKRIKGIIESMFTNLRDQVERA